MSEGVTAQPDPQAVPPINQDQDSVGWYRRFVCETDVRHHWTGP